MRLMPYDRKIVLSETVNKHAKGPRANSLQAHLDAIGCKTPVDTIRSRMSKQGMTFEEAVAYKTKTRSEAARMKKFKSHWSKEPTT